MIVVASNKTSFTLEPVRTFVFVRPVIRQIKKLLNNFMCMILAIGIDHQYSGSDIGAAEIGGTIKILEHTISVSVLFGKERRIDSLH